MDISKRIQSGILSPVLFAAVFIISSSFTYGSKEFEFDGRFYLMDQLEEINADLKWEESGPLEDIADRYANCESSSKIGMFPVDDVTPGGLSVMMVVDAGKGWETDIFSVQMYVRHVVTRWVHNSTYIEQFKSSEGVGCRMQPGCNGFTTVSCAFSYRLANEIGSGPTGENPSGGPGAGTGTVAGKPRAFARDQYTLMEKLTRKTWDRSHYLENLASYDARCSMVGSADWKFQETESYVQKWKTLQVSAEYGSKENKGSTDNAIVEIIKAFSGNYGHLTRIGCCLIPDCASSDGKTYVVVVCLYA